MLGVDLKPLEETCLPLLLRRRGRRVFRASVFKMLKEEGKIGDDLINRLMLETLRLQCTQRGKGSKG